MILTMTRPVTTSRVVLVEDRRGAVDGAAPVLPLRRYRLARLRSEGQSAIDEGRYSHLKHSHD